MEIILLTRFNPYFSNSASANRLISLVEGLLLYKISINFYITNGYQNKNEINQVVELEAQKGIKFNYLSKSIIDTIWKKRFDNYFNLYFKQLIIGKRINRIIGSKNKILWLENDYLILKVIFSKTNRSLKTFIEISEFLDIHEYNHGNRFQKRKADLKRKFFYNIVLSSLSGLALMTRTLFSDFSFYNNLKIVHLPMTVDLNRFNGSKEILDKFKSPYIAFVGVMDDKKDGVSILIEAFNKIKDQYPSHSVYLVGGWNYDTPHHLKLINEYNLTDRVHWMKEYPRDLIPNIICNADLLVLPRPDSKQAQGGFPTKLGEYLASGVPVCATTVGEIPDYLEDNESVFFAEPGSVESFADAMNRALSDPLNAKRVGLNGRAVAEKDFNKDIQAKKLYDFLKSL